MELVTHFNRWCTALEAKTFGDLCNLMVLEQFKDSLPGNVATYTNEREVKTAAAAAAFADECVLMHKVGFESCACDTGVNVHSGKWSDGNLWVPQIVMMSMRLYLLV